MREILFKAKRKDNGEWVEGWLFKTQEHTYIAYDRQFDDDLFLSPQNIFIEVDENTICQYTGLTDKNGNKIWENDILVDDIYSVVRWDDEEARFVIDDYGTEGCLMEYGFDEYAGEYGVVETNGFDDFCSMQSFEVIGNIFDSPALLEGGEC